MSLRPLQNDLENIYELDAGHNVDDFIITDKALAQSLDQGRSATEKLLVRQDETGENVDIALYFDSELIERLAQDNPKAQLHDGNLNDFCVALEGISHFLCLIFNCQRQRPVTRLELELQAEIDKFVMAVGLFGHQLAGSFPRRLHYALFENFRLLEDLNSVERTRYREANRYAGKYCYGLQSRFVARQSAKADGILNELRQFYRLPLQEKLRHIEQAD